MVNRWKCYDKTADDIFFRLFIAVFFRLASGILGPALVILGFGILFDEAEAASLAGARLQALDKVTARISTFDVTVGGTASFGPLSITVRHCEKSPPEEPPESIAFMEIDEKSMNGQLSVLFTGWMFASSPALNAMEHSVYDIWLLECIPSPE